MQAKARRWFLVYFTMQMNLLRSLDPHIWLDFNNAKIMVNNITRVCRPRMLQIKDFYKERQSEHNKKVN